MATPFQNEYWGKEYDDYKRTSDIPGVPSPIAGLSREQYIANKFNSNPSFSASDRDKQESKKSRNKLLRDADSFISRSIPFAGELAKADANLGNMIDRFPRQATSEAANWASDKQTESEYYDATGQNLPSKAIYAIDDINDTVSQLAGVLSQPAEEKPWEQSAKEAEKQMNEGGLPVVNPGESPSAAVASMNNNRIKGIGNSSGGLTTPTPPPAPTPQEQQKKAFEAEGNKLSFDQNKIPEWYDSKSFSAGLLSFGLNLLSGNDLATSFNQAANLFMNTFGEEKRSIWAEDLADSGYDPTEIEEWIRTGDSKILTSADERRMKDIQMQTSLTQLDALQYANSPEMRQYALDNDAFDKNYKLAELDLKRQANAISASRAAAANARSMSGGNGSANMTFIDDDGKQWVIATNARGTPIINSQGVATMYDPETGRATQRLLYDAPRVQAALQAEDTLNVMDNLVKSGNLSLTGGYGIQRRAGDLMGQNTTKDLESELHTINEAVGGQIFAQLLVESGGKRVTDNQLKAEIKRVGQLDIKQSPERNAQILDNMRGFVQKSYHSGTKTHDTVANTDRSTPAYRQTSSSQANLSATPAQAKIVNGYLYRGGDYNDPKNWTKL